MKDKRLTRIHLLVIDSDQTIRNLLSTVLKKLGFSSITCVADGFEAIKWLRKHPVDLVLTDWNLQPSSHLPAIPENTLISSEWGNFPPHNGASFVKCLRHSRFSPDPFVPVIMFVGPTRADSIRYARDAGVNEILVKPIIAEELCKRIIDIIEKPRAFITSENYKGPCRRHRAIPLNGTPEKRKQEVRVISYAEQKRILAHG